MLRVLKKEQNCVDLLKPEYNILTKAGSSLGFKHGPETFLKFKARKLTPEALINLKKARSNATFTPLARTNQLLSPGHSLIITNKLNNTVKESKSIRAKFPAKYIKVNHSTRLNYIDKNKLLRGIYKIIKKNFLALI